jgi:hypothetical protein
LVTVLAAVENTSTFGGSLSTFCGSAVVGLNNKRFRSFRNWQIGSLQSTWMYQCAGFINEKEFSRRNTNGPHNQRYVFIKVVKRCTKSYRLLPSDKEFKERLIKTVKKEVSLFLKKLQFLVLCEQWPVIIDTPELRKR